MKWIRTESVRCDRSSPQASIIPEERKITRIIRSSALFTFVCVYIKIRSRTSAQPPTLRVGIWIKEGSLLSERDAFMELTHGATDTRAWNPANWSCDQDRYRQLLLTHLIVIYDCLFPVSKVGSSRKLFVAINKRKHLLIYRLKLWKTVKKCILLVQK